MADSDDEHERGRRGSRDKFRRERSDYSSRSRSGRDDWERRRSDPGWGDRDRDRGRRRDHREYDGGQRRGRRDRSPPYKRMKRDWDDVFYRDYGMHFSPHMSHPAPWNHPMMDGGRASDHADYPTQPAMMSFRQYLNSQPDDLEETKAVEKYTEYKREFSRKIVTDFFDAHKDEEWLRVKYHPVESMKHQEEQKAFVQQRQKVFFELLELGQIDRAALDIENQNQIIKILNAAVILLEGGSAYDLKSLDQPSGNDQSISDDKKTNQTQATDDDTKQGDGNKTEQKDLEEGEADTTADEQENKKEANEQEQTTGTQEETVKTTEETADNNKQQQEEQVANVTDEGKEGNKQQLSTQEEQRTVMATETVEDKGKETLGDEKKEDDLKMSDEASPKPLHATKSIYIRTLSPNIKKSDVVKFSQNIPGYLRVAFAEPQAERRFHRRGWITFCYDVDIKEICSQVNNTKVGDFELNMMVNRDFTNRVRHVSGFSATRQLAHHDLEKAIKLIQYLDDHVGLWKSKEGDEANPLLSKLEVELESEGLSDQWTSEEAAASRNGSQSEKGEAEEGEEKQDVVPLERNIKLLQALDRALLYLRIVHSLDYYDAKEYPFEDNMPNRCCILHVRGILPSRATQSEVLEYWNAFQQKIDVLFNKHQLVPLAEAKELGMKDPESEVQAFIKSNTQELGKDKWLCPLSGKKFRAPEFVVKHIQNKHADKLENVKHETEYLNAYIRDPNRPNLPLPPKTPNRMDGNSRGDMTASAPPGPGGWGRRPMMYGAPFGRFPLAPEMFGSPSLMIPRRGRQDPRGIRDYRDLDAPEEMDV